MDFNDTPDLSNIIVLHPHFEKLKADVDRLRTELSMLVLERDEILYQECKNIEMAYMLSVGGLEYKAYEFECAIFRLKRKAELIQAKKNRLCPESRQRNIFASDGCRQAALCANYSQGEDRELA